MSVGLEALTAVVLNWNQPELTERAVQGLLDDGVLARRLVVVDNASTDGSWERFRERLAACTLVRIDENVGFARGNNAGAKVLPGDTYLFVNSDAFVHRPGSVGLLLAALDRPGVGIAVPRLLNEDLTLQPSVSPAPRPIEALVRASGLSRFVPNDRQPRWSTHWDHGRSREVENAVGAVVLVRGTAWDCVSGFPETGFMYAEDLGLCMAVRRQGWAVWFSAEAEFVHLGGGSTSARWSSESRSERVGRANAALVREHLSPRRAALTLAVMRAGFAARLAAWTLAGRRDAAAEQRGYWRGYAAPTVESRGEARAEPAITVLRPGAA